MGNAENASIGELRAFRAVYERGSFAAAAQDLGLDPSIVSRRIRSLETRLKLTLFARNTRSVAPTPPAERYYPRVVDALGVLAEAHAELASFDGVLRGSLRLSAPAELGRTVVGPLLQRFLADHDEVQAELVLADRQIDLVQERIDLALRVGIRPPKTSVVRQLGVSQQALVATPAYAQAHPGPTHALVWHTQRGTRAEAWEQLPTRQGLTLRLVTNDLRAAYDAVLAGVGASVLPTWLVQGDLEAGRLVSLPAPGQLPAPPVYVELPAGRRTHVVARAFLEVLTTHWA